MENNIYKKLLKIQEFIKVNKNNINNFGKYKYRSCEDILTAVKPLCIKLECVLTISDELVLVGERYYVKATSKLTNIDNPTDYTEVTAYARECEDKKGMDSSQLTGATSSYARKYSLSGLLALDDNKDADTNEFKQQTGDLCVDCRKEVLSSSVKQKTKERYGEIVCSECAKIRESLNKG